MRSNADHVAFRSRGTGRAYPAGGFTHALRPPGRSTDNEPESEMAENATEGKDEAAPAAKPNKVLLVAAVLAGLLAGGVAGRSMLGPKVALALAERELAPKPEGGGHGGGGEEGSPIHVIDNLVVNPARSGGTRFLLSTIAIETGSTDLAAAVATHDVELRDVLIVTLGGKTTDELSDIERRPELIVQLQHAIEEVTGPGVVQHVYLPQFVIQ